MGTIQISLASTRARTWAIEAVVVEKVFPEQERHFDRDPFAGVVAAREQDRRLVLVRRGVVADLQRQDLALLERLPDLQDPGQPGMVPFEDPQVGLELQSAMVGAVDPPGRAQPLGRRPQEAACLEVVPDPQRGERRDLARGGDDMDASVLAHEKVEPLPSEPGRGEIPFGDADDLVRLAGGRSGAAPAARPARPRTIAVVFIRRMIPSSP